MLRASKWFRRPVAGPIGAAKEAVGGANPGKALKGGTIGVDPNRPNPATGVKAGPGVKAGGGLQYGST